MTNKGWLWASGVACVLAAACSDNGASEHAAGGAAGSAPSTAGTAGVAQAGSAGIAGSGSTHPAGNGDDAGSGGDAGIGSTHTAGSGGDGGAPCAGTEAGSTDPFSVACGASCTGTLAEAADAFGFSCPAEFCAAKLFGGDCAALPDGVTKTVAKSCQSMSDAMRVSFELSQNRHKVCYYNTHTVDGDSVLIGAAAWDDKASFCNGTAVEISGGQLPAACHGPVTATLCDLERPAQDQVDDVPARACFNNFSRSCEPCCPATQPDCTDKSQNYPPYSCTPVRPGIAYCSCGCQSDTWSCGC